jgi:hypothetical protein
MKLKTTTTTLAALASLGLAATSANAALVIRADTNSTDWLLQTSEGAGSQTFEGNTVTSTVGQTTGTWSRGVVGQPAYGFIQYSTAGAGAATPATATGTWSFTNLAAGAYDVATTFRANGASSVRHTVNGAEFFVDQSTQPAVSAGPSFTTNYIGQRAHDYNFITLDTVTVTEGGSITVTIDNSNTASLIAMDTVGITAAVPEPTTTALLGLGGLALILRRRK